MYTNGSILKWTGTQFVLCKLSWKPNKFLWNGNRINEWRGTEIQPSSENMESSLKDLFLKNPCWAIFSMIMKQQLWLSCLKHPIKGGGGGIVLSIVMATQLQLWWVWLKVQRLCIINPLDPVQGSQVVQLDIISFPALTVPAVHLLMVESCLFIRAKLCRVS